jgi:hypothetical protein
MKRIFLSFLIALTLITGMNQKPAEAAVGIATGGIALPIIGGIYIAAFGTILGFEADRFTHLGPSDRLGSYRRSSLIADMTLSSIFVALGIILLDDQGNFEFAKLDAASAQKLKVNSQELAIYNSEVQELNSISENVAQELQGSTDVQKSKAIWESYENAVSPETLVVARQIAGSVFSR